jgi:hypothetical protein
VLLGAVVLGAVVVVVLGAGVVVVLGAGVVVEVVVLDEENEGVPVEGLLISSPELLAEGFHVDRSGGEHVFIPTILFESQELKNATSAYTPS